MKKTLLILSTILFASAANLQAQETVAEGTLTGNWAQMTGGLGGDIAAKMDVNAQGEIFFTTEAKTEEGKNWFEYDGNRFEGSGFAPNKDANFYNNSDMALYKIDQNGKLQMALYSDRGYFDKNSPVVATADGGCLLALKAKIIHKGLFMDKDNGKKITFRMHNSLDKDYVYTIEEPGMNAASWVNKGYLIKIDKTGKVEWKKDINTDTTSVNGKSCADMFKFEDAAQDAQGNFYVLGNFSRPLNVEGAAAPIEPNNIPEDWDVKSSSAASMFIVKYDAKGNYKGILTNKKGSNIAYEGPKSLVVDNNNLYVMGYVKGKKGQIATFADKSMTLFADKNNHQFYMKISDFDNAKVDFIKVLESTLNSNSRTNVKPMNMEIADDKIIICGGLTGGLKDGESKLVENLDKMLHGYVLTASAKDGKTLAATELFYDGTIAEAESTHVEGNNIYVSGYTNSFRGWLSVLNKETLKAEKVYTAYTTGNATLTNAVYFNNKVTMFGRGKAKPFVVDGVDGSKLDPKDKDWEILVANFNLPTSEGSVENLFNEADGLKVFASNGKINVTANKAEQIYVYNASGVLLNSFVAEEGTTTIDMPQGFYIVNGQKVIVY